MSDEVTQAELVRRALNEFLDRLIRLALTTPETRPPDAHKAEAAINASDATQSQPCEPDS